MENRVTSLDHKCRILFINPPYERLKGFSVESIPLGLLSIATVLSNHGYSVKVYDADTSFETGRFNYNNVKRAETQPLYLESLKDDNLCVWQEVRNLLHEYKPDIVGVTMMSPAYSSCRKIFKIMQESKPRPLIIAGGPHITICKETVLKENPELDFGIVGEGENTMLDFLKHLFSDNDFSTIGGLIYRNNNDILFAGERPFIEDLDSLPIPDRSLLHNEKRYRPAKLSQMLTSRGCPFECAFCASVPLWKRKVRRRSPAKLLEEIDYLVKKYKIRSFGFWDDTFTINKKYVIDFCNLLIKKYGSNKFVWKCITNINCLDEELLSYLKKARCKSISIGIESGSDRILQAMKKRTTTSQIRKIVKVIKSKGFWIDTFFMVGIPYETEEDIKKSINFIKELNPDSVNLCTFTPYVGTVLYDYAIKKGFINPGDYSIYDKLGHHSIYNFLMENITGERYKSLLQEILATSTAISNKITFRKIKLKFQGLTFEKIMCRLKQGTKPKRG